MKTTLFLSLAILGLLTGTAHAQPAACHALAASPADPERKGPGVAYAKIDGARAAAACAAAVKASPKDGQLWFQYGRALEKVNQVAEAFAAYEKGADLDNPGALNNLGELYRDGKGVTRNPYMAEVLFQNASVGNFPEATQNLTALEKNRPPVAARTIPNQFRGKFSSSGQTCQQTQEMNKHFGGEFMGIQVGATEITKNMEFMCTVLNVSVDSPQQASVIMKCAQNSPTVRLTTAVLTPESARLGSAPSGGQASVRCGK